MKDGIAKVLAEAVDPALWRLGKTMVFGKDDLLRTIHEWHRANVAAIVQAYCQARTTKVRCCALHPIDPPIMMPRCLRGHGATLHVDAPSHWQHPPPSLHSPLRRTVALRRVAPQALRRALGCIWHCHETGAGCRPGGERAAPRRRAPRGVGRARAESRRATARYERSVRRCRRRRTRRSERSGRPCGRSDADCDCRRRNGGARHRAARGNAQRCGRARARARGARSSGGGAAREARRGSARAPGAPRAPAGARSSGARYVPRARGSGDSDKSRRARNHACRDRRYVRSRECGARRR